MTEDLFIKQNAKRWTELEDVLRAVSRRRKTWQDSSELLRLDGLYRTCASHLAYAQTYYPDTKTFHYLNTLVARAHNRIYARRRGIGDLLRFYTRSLPGLLRECRWFIAAAAAIFIIAGLFSFTVTWLDSGLSHVFLGGMRPDMESSGHIEVDSALISSEIMTNNIRVSILAFAFGIFACFGTIYIIAQNGLLLGSLSALFMQNGRGVVYWSLILPHGVFELYAIFVSAAAGLMLGTALINPGRYSRRDAIAEAGKKALRLLGLVCPLLVIAGIIEGFLTPSGLPAFVKLVFSGVTTVLLVAYVMLGRKRSRMSAQALEKGMEPAIS